MEIRLLDKLMKFLKREVENQEKISSATSDFKNFRTILEK